MFTDSFLDKIESLQDWFYKTVDNLNDKLSLDEPDTIQDIEIQVNVRDILFKECSKEESNCVFVSSKKLYDKIRNKYFYKLYAKTADTSFYEESILYNLYKASRFKYNMFQGSTSGEKNAMHYEMLDLLDAIKFFVHMSSQVTANAQELTVYQSIKENNVRYTFKDYLTKYVATRIFRAGHYNSCLTLILESILYDYCTHTYFFTTLEKEKYKGRDVLNSSQIIIVARPRPNYRIDMYLGRDNIKLNINKIKEYLI